MQEAQVRVLILRLIRVHLWLGQARVRVRLDVVSLQKCPILPHSIPFDMVPFDVIPFDVIPFE